jgi:hypothetical protein
MNIKKNNFKIITFLFLIFSVVTSDFVHAQEPFKLSSGQNVLELGGIVSSYLNLRTYPTGVTPKLQNNTFKLKDARLDLNGKFGNDFDFHLQMDFAGFGSPFDPVNPLINDAHITYKGLHKLFNIRMGYGKVPYSMNSNIDHEWTPFWERPQVTKGDFFSRRDLGFRLDRTFWNGRIKAIGGIYTGAGEVSLAGSNDPSGGFEYIGRVEVGFPERRTEHEAIIDTKISNKPNIQFGLNGRFTRKNLPVGKSFLTGESGALVDSPYNFKVIDGEKFIYGADIALAYKGFSVQAEGHILKGTPQNSDDPLLNFTAPLNNKGYFKAGGWLVIGNYYSKLLKSIFAVRYEELNANDLIPGYSKRIAYSYCYQLKNFNSMIRAEYDRILSQTESINTTSYNGQFRIGWQFVIE